MRALWERRPRRELPVARFLAALIILLVGRTAAAAPTAEAFFATPEFDAVSVSPDGAHLAALVPGGGGRSLMVMDADHAHARVIPVPGTLRDFRWVTDERLLLTIGDEHQAPGLAAVNRDGLDYRVLVPPAADAATRAGASLVDRLPGQPGRVLVSIDRRSAFEPDVFRLDVFDGTLARVVRNPGGVFRWLADRHGRVRAAMSWRRTTDGLLYGVWHRFLPDGRWQRLYGFPPGGPALRPLAFDPDNRHLYVSASAGRDTAAIYRYDPASRRLGDPVFARPGVDVTGLELGESRVAAVSWDGAVPGRRVFDRRRQRREAWLDRRLPGLEHRVTSTSRDGNSAIVLAYSDTRPGRYYLLQREANGFKLAPVGPRLPWLEGRLVPRRPVHFSARDGTRLQAYLTRPEGGPDGKPLLVIPHGGPWARDRWGFDPQAQFFASRGFAVLQVNFRGSAGFGRDFLNAGRRDWDGVMLNDLADGARWAIASGVADPERVAVLGASFGGYAALMSAVRYPDLYRCAVSFAGVTDLEAQIRGLKSDGNDRAFNEWRAMVGDPDRDPGRLVDASPLNYARSFPVPVMLAYGGLDTRVPPGQTLALAHALGKAGKAFRLLRYPGAAHGLSDPAQRADFHRRALAFLLGQL